MKICDETIRNAIDNELSDVVLNDMQKQAILQHCSAQRSEPKLNVVARRHPIRRGFTIAACFGMAMVISCGALAAAPDLRESLKGLSDYTLKMLQPIHEVSEDQGIRMEVLGAIDDGRSSVAFISLQDAAGLGRVSDTVRLMDYEVSDADLFTNDSVVSYDSKTETAVLRLQGVGRDAGNNKVTVSVGSVLSGETYLKNQPTGYTVEQLEKMGNAAEPYHPQEDEIQQYAISAEKQDQLEEIGRLVEQNQMLVLKPWENSIPIQGIEWANITAAAKIGNQVHIRYNTDTVLGGVSCLDFSLQDQNGEILELPTLEMSIGNPIKVSDTIRYTHSKEYVLMLPEEKKEESFTILYSGTGYEQFTQGNWRTTFKMEKAEEKLTAEVDCNFGEWKIEEITVSPIGIWAQGIGAVNGEDVPEIEVWKKDGTRVEIDSASTSVEDKNIFINGMFTELLDLSQVENVTLNGKPLHMEFIKH